MKAVSISTPKVKAKQSQIISKVLGSAVRLWLRSQVEFVEDLQLQIEAGDRQILSGKISQVSLAAHKAIYQGLHLSQIQLEARSIGINLSQVLRGQPLRLLEPIPICGQLQLQAADLKASLESPLLVSGLKDLLLQLLSAGGISNPEILLKDWQICFSQLALETDRLTLAATLVNANGYVRLITLKTGLQLVSPHQLRLSPLELHTPPELPIGEIDAFEIDLGSDVMLETLSLTSEALICCGNAQVNP